MDKPNLPKKLKVIYVGGIDSDLDNQLEEAMEKIGYHRWARGFCPESNERDLAFDRSP